MKPKAAGAKRGTPAVRSLLMAGLVAVGGCTTLPGMPEEGAGSKWVLATVEHVEGSEEQLEREILGEVDGRVKNLVEKLLAEERKRIDGLEQTLAQHIEALEELRAQLTETEETLAAAASERAALGAAVTEGLGDLAQISAQLERVIAQLNTRMDEMPADTLREFNTAIERYLALRERERELAEGQLQPVESESAPDTQPQQTGVSSAPALPSGTSQ